MLFFWISLDLDLRSQVISWSLLVPSCSIIFTYKKLTPPTLASGITSSSHESREGSHHACHSALAAGNDIAIMRMHVLATKIRPAEIFYYR